MATQATNRREAALYEDIYKNVKMGASSTVDMMKRLTDGQLKAELGRELAEYETLAKEAGDALRKMGVEPKEETLMARMSAKAGVMMNTMIDSTPSHIAGMVIEGCAMGTSDLVKSMNACRREDDGACGEAMSLAQRAVRFEEECAEKMKAYL